MKIIRLMLSSILLVWCGGFFYFLQITDDISNDNRTITDAIVVFGGNKQNLYVGVQLLKLGYAPIVFITGDKPKEEYNNFLKTQQLSPEQFIFDENIAKNKHNHVMDTVMFLKKYKFHSLRLVVNAVQLPRALRELLANIPPDTVVIPHPISSKQKNHLQIFKEYTKYTLVLVASFIGKEDELDLPYS
jgi:uncharacterized SAM-binding protein YcdF (DUF218 family)